MKRGYPKSNSAAMILKLPEVDLIGLSSWPVQRMDCGLVLLTVLFYIPTFLPISCGMPMMRSSEPQSLHSLHPCQPPTSVHKICEIPSTYAPVRTTRHSTVQPLQVRTTLTASRNRQESILSILCIPHYRQELSQ